MFLPFRVLVLGGCFLLAAPTAFAFDILQPLPAKAAVPADNPMSPGKTDLGKQLFFDPRLSLNGRVSCNSCHNLMLGGADQTPTSTGAAGKAGKRNAPTLWNVAIQTVLFWEGRAKSLEEALQEHLLDETVMALPDEAALADRIAAIPAYGEQFRALFGSDAPLSLANTAKALAAFIRTLLTPDSPYDRYLKGDGQALSALAKEGLAAFQSVGCVACHFGVNLAGPAPGPAMGPGDGFYELFPNFVGSPYDELYDLMGELGRVQATGDPGHERMWRLPTLRNIALTAPYFHNGSVASLGEAVRVMARTEWNKTISDREVEAIVEFLKSLTGERPVMSLPALPPASPYRPRPWQGQQE
ncbi:MAG TPA: c-type cytochrome [Gammaproteobacteria bacterium]|nr:c-type cytochrome [Gammaproteobacteria bacterium]